MIPPHKLKELPRSQRLRKCAKIFEEAERRFLLTETISAEEAEYLCGAAESLARDEKFSGAARAALEDARITLAASGAKAGMPEEAAAHGGTAFTPQANSAAAGKDAKVTRRALNTVYTILLAETGRNRADWDFTEASGALDPSRRRAFKGMRVYLEDIRSPFNVGSMFRAAESFGAEKIWLSPLCASPRHKRAERTAMGCVDVLPWEYLCRDPFARDVFAGGTFPRRQFDAEREPFARDVFAAGPAANEPSGKDPLPAASFTERTAAGGADFPFSGGPIFALETGGTPLEDFPFPPQGILIAGSEELGVSPRALSAADASLGRVTIPVWGAKGSLNVSVAFGIVMHAWAERLMKL